MAKFNILKNKKLWIYLLIALSALGVLFVWGNLFTGGAGVETLIGDAEVDTPTTQEKDITLSGVYWGTSENPADENTTCSQEVIDNEGFAFTVEADTRIKIGSYDLCYITNNGHEVNTTVFEEFGSYIDVQGMAETDVENEIGLCCVLGERTDCSSSTLPLIMCDVNQTE